MSLIWNLKSKSAAGLNLALIRACFLLGMFLIRRGGYDFRCDVRVHASHKNKLGTTKTVTISWDHSSQTQSRFHSFNGTQLWGCNHRQPVGVFRGFFALWIPDFWLELSLSETTFFVFPWEHPSLWSNPARGERRGNCRVFGMQM